MGGVGGDGDGDGGRRGMMGEREQANDDERLFWTTLMASGVIGHGEERYPRRGSESEAPASSIAGHPLAR